MERNLSDIKEKISIIREKTSNIGQKMSIILPGALSSSAIRYSCLPPICRGKAFRPILPSWQKRGLCQMLGWGPAAFPHMDPDSFILVCKQDPDRSSFSVKNDRRALKPF
jgi:hypothetical protein